MNKFVIIDGNAILHRAFHALPPLATKDGQLTNAVYGFFSMLLKIVQDLKPEYLAVCFDRPKPTFRQTLYVGYQAHRPKMDEGLASQIILVHEILEKAGIQIFEIDGYEADDIIGTLAFQAMSLKNQRSKIKDQKENEMEDARPASPALGMASLGEAGGKWKMEVIIVSGDRDMLQLVNSFVKVLAPIIGITKMILYDEQKVEEKYGIKPNQIIDYKALVGDASDGYPGVSGVGPKTAMELFKKYETLENLYQNLEEIKAKNENLVLKLANGAEAAGLAKKLATIVTDAPVTLEMKKCDVGRIDREKMKEEFEKFGFKSLLSRIKKQDDNNLKDSRGFVKSQSQRSNLKGQNQVRLGQNHNSKLKAKSDNKQLGLL